MMKSISTPLWILGSAALGQAFLAQTSTPWTLWPGLALAFWAAWKFSSLPAPKGPTRPLDPKWEAGLLLGIFCLGLFLRTYRLEEFPPGLPADQGFMGLTALKVLHEGWDPFPSIYHSQVPDLFSPLALSAWFRFVDPSLLGFRLFFVVLSLASFPFLYWTFRQLSGPRAALLSLFLFSVMRWDWVLARNGQPALETIFFLSTSLAFFLHGLSQRSLPFLSLGALICGAGFYAYPSLKVIPLLLGVLAWREFRRDPAFPKKAIFVPFLVLLLACLPRLADLAQHGLPERESSAFLGTVLLEKGSLSPLLSVWGGTALLFNRSGDPSPWYNVGGRRMLDDVTGVFFLLGLAWAWRKRKDREGFFIWAGLTVTALPGLLSVDPAASHRLAGMVPFVVYLAAGAGSFLWDSLFSKGRKALSFALGSALLLTAALQNAWVYFHLQAPSPAYREASSPTPLLLGQRIVECEKEGKEQRGYWVSPGLWAHPTLSFLTYPSQIGRLDLPEWMARSRPKDQDAVLFAEGDKRGTPGFLMELFPGSKLSVERDEEGRPALFEVEVPREILSKAPAWDRGLKGEYLDLAGKRTAVRVDPLIDLSGLRDFPPPQRPPFHARWTGTLEAPVTGEYLFHLLSSDKTALWLNGRSIALEKPVRLRQGPHALKVEFVKEEGYYPALHFIWKKPGADAWEVVPAGVFGKISP